MATAGAKVTVACKIGVAWFDLQLCEQRIVMENTQTGPREVKQFARTGNIVRIRGTSYPRGTPPIGFPERPAMINGYALTPGVDKDFWTKWLEQNARAPYVLSGMIMAFENVDAMKGKTRDVTDLSGLEPVKPDNDPRMPLPSLKGLEGLQTEEGRKATVAKAVEAA